MGSVPTDYSITGLLSPNIDWQTLSYPTLKLGILASGNGSNFEAIMDAIEDSRLNAKVNVVVCNNPGANVLERAAKWSIPTVLLNHREFASREVLDQAIVDTLVQHDVGWVIMAGWMRRVTQHLIDAFSGRLLNIHPSLLPSFPGLHAVQQALDAGVQLAGCTVHYVELAVDSGPIIMQAAVPVLAGDTEASLQSRIQVQEHRIYPAAIALAAHAHFTKTS
ncbi:phosphoribosylglycinamide formyltransferase [Leptolyngbyaceae cyanobacterium CCMR0082]|uniref:Phosphoribosylglycinamide formyltransferase n=2 Tax=Adonisia turfae TaxID=2950184 RepID=A0A6M0S317_9CYAN|nr:phosphoribosylglycinamide formyltransferase [Adonisia turfae]MDV3349442.1 phosphoribosylglycinamide formyltransferase [Leptothoe sp. LEGE 181152]NEZ54913.1 phosphoribosylglycinamide formyltransferase [Adonisia turfae CCMR0081]NEZ62857.1 phosphoribosylglycinamide formyltransferase [Adonisia turfae CCMR0082]